MFVIGAAFEAVRYHIGDISLQPVDEVRDLGFFFDRRLNFDRHYKTLVSKAMHRTYNLFKATTSRNASILIKAYKTYVRPIVECATTVFSPCKKKDINFLETVQNNFTRKLAMRCSGLSYRFVPSGIERNKCFGLQSLKARRKVNDLMMV